MKSQNRPCYHCFLLLSGWNLLAFYVFIGHPAISTNGLFSFDNPLFNYFFFVSLSLLLTWLTYFLCRKKLGSKRLMALHILLTAAIVFSLPWIVKHFSDSTPTGYLALNNPSALQSLFAGHSRSFIFIIMTLLLSDLFLLANIATSQKARKV
jgi:hypothetical protein